MTAPILLRSMLYVPAANTRAMAKASSLDVDAIIFDLEDAVGRDVLVSSRAALVDVLKSASDRPRMVRVNAVGTEELSDDINSLSIVSPDALVLPKAGSVADIEALLALTSEISGLSELPVWAMLETPQGILNAKQIMEHPSVAGMILGSNDLLKELKAEASADRIALLPSIGLALLAARAAGKWAIDAVSNQFRDVDLFLEDARLGRRLGFDGKSLIHPAQIEPTHQVFSPSEDEVKQAQRIVAAFENAKSDGKSVAVLDGSMIEELHVIQAKSVLAQNALISERTSI